MLKKNIKYTNFDGVERSKDFYFNLTRGELLRAEIRHATISEDEKMQGGLREKLMQVSRSKDGGKIMDAFEDILRLSYGVRSDDGERFMKEPHLFIEFTQTPAYDVLFEELVTDAEQASKFINSIIPADLSDQVNSDSPDRPYPNHPGKRAVEQIADEVMNKTENPRKPASDSEVLESPLTAEEQEIMARLRAKLEG